MRPHQTFDDRDAWGHARRLEVFRYAQELGVKEIKDGPNGIPPKDLMIEKLKSLGHPPPQVAQRPIGFVDSRSGDTGPNSHHYNGQQTPPPVETVEMNALTVLERDWAAQQATTPPAAEMTITEVRKELKRRGIKMARTDNMAALKAKLNGE